MRAEAVGDISEELFDKLLPHVKDSLRRELMEIVAKNLTFKFEEVKAVREFSRRIVASVEWEPKK